MMTIHDNPWYSMEFSGILFSDRPKMVILLRLNSAFFSWDCHSGTRVCVRWEQAKYWSFQVQYSYNML